MSEKIELFWNCEYFRFFQLILGYKQTFTFKTSWHCAIINAKDVLHVGHSIMNGMHHEVLTVVPQD